MALTYYPPNSGSFSERERKSNSPNVKIFAMFAHKGGVAKTTNVYHMAFQMALSGKKVILVDADPQCTLTETCCSEMIDRNWREGEERGNLPTAWEAAYEAMLEGSKIPSASLVVPDRADLCSQNGGSLFLIPGSLESYKLERRLSYAQDLEQRDWLEDVPGWEVLRETVGVMRILLLATAIEYKADVVLIDMGPSICDLNFNVLFSSDFFIVPSNADRYSKGSLYTITSVLQHWSEKHQELITLNAKNKCRMKIAPPKFAGIIFSRVPQSRENIPIYVNAKWMEECCNVVLKLLLPTLEGLNMVASNISSIEDDYYMLEQIPMFTEVHEIAMRCHAPVFGMEPTLVRDINDKGEEVLLEGAALETALASGNEYLIYFENLNERLFEVVRNDMV